jgi:hypothetical protein
MPLTNHLTRISQADLLTFCSESYCHGHTANHPSDGQTRPSATLVDWAQNESTHTHTHTHRALRCVELYSVDRPRDVY